MTYRKNFDHLGNRIPSPYRASDFCIAVIGVAAVIVMVAV